jgi:uncharacterized protein
MTMTSKADVEDFLAQKTLAVVGVSRNAQKFGNAIYKEMKAKGYTVYPVNPNAETIDGDKCYPSLAALPAGVGGVVVTVSPSKAEAVVNEAAQAGITRVWLQQGAQSGAAIKAAQDKGLKVVAGECLLMYARPAAGFHKFHGFIWKMVGKGLN